jgi:hypothetical protein
VAFRESACGVRDRSRNATEGVPYRLLVIIICLFIWRILAQEGGVCPGMDGVKGSGVFLHAGGRRFLRAVRFHRRHGKRLPTASYSPTRSGLSGKGADGASCCVARGSDKIYASTSDTPGDATCRNPKRYWWRHSFSVSLLFEMWGGRRRSTNDLYVRRPRCTRSERRSRRPCWRLDSISRSGWRSNRPCGRP